MSVICKAGDLGKLRWRCNSGHSRVDMFFQTLLKAYIHIKYIKRQCIGILFFVKKTYSIMKLNMTIVSYQFIIWKNNKGKKLS